MARSTTVWAAALVLASFSGSGPLLTTAEAMPAPGPQETQGRPRYYFPRHIKRQIVTNTTAPAAPTSSPPVVLSSTSSEQLESRQVPNRASSFLESLFGNRPGSSSNVLGSASESELTSTVTSVQEIIVTPVPDSSERRPDGTGNLRPTPPSEPVNARPPPPSSSAPSSAPTQPEQKPEPVPAPRSSSVARASPNNPLLGTGSLPVIVAPSASLTPSPSSAPPAVVVPPSPAADPSSGIPSEIVRPTSSSQPGLLSSLLGGVFASTGTLPSSVVQPTPSPESPSSSFLGPFIVPGSSGSPSSVDVQPTPSQNFLGGLLSSVLGTPEATPSPEIGSTGVLPSSIVVPTSVAAAVPSSDTPLIVLPSSGGIVVGITTALGTGAPTPSPVLSSGAIPTSEAASPSAPPLNLPSILSSLVSEVSGVLPSGSAGPTAPTTPSPAPTPSGVLPPLVSSLVADVSSLLSSAVPELSASVVPSIASSIVLESPLPSATGSIVVPPASSLVSSLLSEISSGLVPTASAVPTPETSLPVPSETPTVTPSPPASASVTPSESGVPGITASASLSPTGSVGSGLLPTPTPSESGSVSIPASEGPVSTGLPSNTPIIVSSAGNATASEAPATSVPVSSIDSATIPIPTTPTPTASPVQSQKPIGSDSATSMIIPSIIIQESTSNAAPSPTSSGIPSALPRVIAPPGGMPTDVSTEDSFLGQVCFKWQLNYPFVAQKDGGNQIFHYLPKAIADGLNISQSEVRNMGLRPLDTTQYQGFITTLAYFTIPKDLQSKLQAQLRNPADPFWHNKDQTVNDLTSLINTACPLSGRPSPDSANPNQAANPAGTPTGGPGDGGALGGNIGASRPINGSAAGIATGAVVGAIAYGAAMFFVARRYRNKRIAHQRSSSVPSTGSRMTYGSIPGGAAAWMHGARNGRITPGSRGSRGSSSSQGRSVRTQQISAPVMAENSLGWN